MNIGSQCFKDAAILKEFQEKGQQGLCDVMKRPDRVLSAESLTSLFDFVFVLYEKSEFSDGVGDTLVFFLDQDWDLFDVPRAEAELVLQYIFEIRTESEKNFHRLHLKRKTAEFVQADSTHKLVTKWAEFSESIKYKYRFFAESLFTDGNLEVIAQRFKKVIEKDAVFYRARVLPEIPANLSELSAPPKEKATPGRANPEGIPYLYLSLDEETTLYEARASKADTVVVAKFVANENIRILDLTGSLVISPITLFQEDELEGYVAYKPLFEKFSRELSRPLRTYDTRLDYLPTQYLCEVVKKWVFDGIKYPSAMRNGGANLAIFDPLKFSCSEPKKFEVRKIKYEYMPFVR